MNAALGGEDFLPLPTPITLPLRFLTHSKYHCLAAKRSGTPLKNPNLREIDASSCRKQSQQHHHERASSFLLSSSQPSVWVT